MSSYPQIRTFVHIVIHIPTKCNSLPPKNVSFTVPSWVSSDWNAARLCAGIVRGDRPAAHAASYAPCLPHSPGPCHSYTGRPYMFVPDDQPAIHYVDPLRHLAGSRHHPVLCLWHEP